MGKLPSKPLSLPHFLSMLGRQENIPKITLHPLPGPNQTTLLFELPPLYFPSPHKSPQPNTLRSLIDELMCLMNSILNLVLIVIYEIDFYL